MVIQLEAEANTAVTDFFSRQLNFYLILCKDGLKRRTHRVGCENVGGGDDANVKTILPVSPSTAVGTRGSLGTAGGEMVSNSSNSQRHTRFQTWPESVCTRPPVCVPLLLSRTLCPLRVQNVMRIANKMCYYNWRNIHFKSNNKNVFFFNFYLCLEAKK